MTINRLLDSVSQDLGYALRSMRKKPGFTVTIVLTLAFVIGANTAIFTVVRAVLLQPLRYSDPERLVQITGGATPIRYDEIRSGARSYTGIGAYYLGQIEEVAITGATAPEPLKQASVSANFLNIIGVEPLLGRGFLAEEDNPGAPRVVLISAGLWQRRFAGDAQILGRPITLAGIPHIVIGVMSADFQFPYSGIDVWVPRPAENVTPFSTQLVLFGRLARGISLQQASAELSVLNQQYAAAHPGMFDTHPGRPAQVLQLKQELVAGVRTMLWVLFGAVSFVLLIACANVAGLLLARSASRQAEFAIRAALGATRGRLISQLLVESLFLALAGGGLGAVFARWSLAAITRATAIDLPRTAEIHLDGGVLLFTFVLSLLTGVVFGLAPSLGASHVDLTTALKSGQDSIHARRIARWFSTRGFLVSGQVALSIVLLIGAALLIESLARLNRVEPGFDPSNLLTMRFSLPQTRNDTAEKVGAFRENLVQRVEALPGVRSAATVFTIPMSGFAMQPVQSADAALLPLNKRPLGVVEFITADYFRTMGIPLRGGREFTARDRVGSQQVTIISEGLARKLWPEFPKTNPIGLHLLIGVNTTPIEVVGIVGDIRQSLDDEYRPGFYRPSLQGGPPSFMFVVKTTGNPLAYANSVRREVLAVDRDQPVSAVKTMAAIMEEEEGQRRLVLLLLEVFASAALLLTAIGIYGTLAYWVVQRTRELGIRRALGAQTKNLLSLVVGKGMLLTAGGIIVGTAGAIGLTRVLQKLLFQISPTDPLTFVAVAAVVFGLTIVACYVPARRATRIEPMKALRSE
jgi:putative ABC transport system permease protein